ncbi:MAG: TolC family protein [Thermodesulfovibrionales bacterium]|jgi:outer membrane protein TolC
MRKAALAAFLILLSLLTLSPAQAEKLSLQPLIDEALKNNHEVLNLSAKTAAYRHRIPQVKSLPDPMFMFGYQNEGWEKFTYGEAQDAQFMFSLSQTFPFAGKLPLKGEMASQEAEAVEADLQTARQRTVEKVRSLYYDLFLSHKSIEIILDTTALFSRIEEAALSRYSSGKGLQEEVLMAQTEKYILLEKEEMLRQRVQTLEAMLNATLGRDVNAPLGIPEEPPLPPYAFALGELISLAEANSPDIQASAKMIASAETRVKLAEREYYPDITVTGNVMARKNFDDMWSLTAAINLPIFYRTKQREGVKEAEAMLSLARHDLDGKRSMIASSIRENYAMIKTAERLMELYRKGIITKFYQDLDLALSGYITGRVEELTVINRVKSIIEYENMYWIQAVEKVKAMARVEALTGRALKGDLKNE